VCAAGSYLDPAASPDSANDKCVTCELLVGGACRGGGNLTAPTLATLPGFWRADPNSTGWYGLPDIARHVIGCRFNSVSASLVTLISSKSRVYLLKDRDPVGLPDTWSAGSLLGTVLIYERDSIPHLRYQTRH